MMTETSLTSPWRIFSSQEDKSLAAELGFSIEPYSIPKWEAAFTWDASKATSMTKRKKTTARTRLFQEEILSTPWMSNIKAGFDRAIVFYQGISYNLLQYFDPNIERPAEDI